MFQHSVDRPECQGGPLVATLGRTSQISKKYQNKKPKYSEKKDTSLVLTQSSSVATTPTLIPIAAPSYYKREGIKHYLNGN